MYKHYQYDDISTYKFIDIHYHANPDAYVRRYNALSAGKIYKQNQGGVILKSHLGSTVQSAMLAQQEGFPVFPSLTLNKIAGGVSTIPIKQALSEYTTQIPVSLIVHLPTITNDKKHKPRVKRNFINRYSEGAAQTPEIISNKNTLLKNVLEVFEFAKDHPIVLSTGHSSYDELMMIIELANTIGLNKILLNQPANPMTGMNYHDLNKIASDNIWIEQTALTYQLGYQNWEDFSLVLNGLKNVIYSSDFGQASQPDIENWISDSHQWFSEMKLSTHRIQDIRKNNIIRLLGGN
jgi:hypothetical protein